MKLGLSSRRAAGGVALLVCLAMAGCAAPTTPASRSTGASGSPVATGVAPTSSVAVDSMTVITQAEAAAALGQSVRPAVQGKATVEGGIAAVFYGPSVPVGTDPDVAVPNSVRVVLVTGSKAQFYFNDYKSKVHSAPVAGLGDQAYYDGYASLSVLKGDMYIRIAVAGARGISLPAEKALASDALPRMQ
jgi:lipopolysaccharide export system protein LptA